MTKRNEVIDIIRAICAIYIIAIFHLNSYYIEEYLFTGNWVVVSKMLTIISLGGFTFISGFCLSKYRFIELRDVRDFYKRRLSRFYFLYFMAAITLFMMKFIIGKGWFQDNTQFF
jgi:surface polysaccharide O-acyltransferase-like enzyme